MAELTKDGITISQDSGTGSAELKLKVANPPYQGFNDKTVEFTINNTQHSISKTFEAKVEGVYIWQWGENFDNTPIEIGSNPQNLSFHVEGRGNVKLGKTVSLRYDRGDSGNVPDTLDVTFHIGGKDFPFHFVKGGSDITLDSSNWNLPEDLPEIYEWSCDGTIGVSSSNWSPIIRVFVNHRNMTPFLKFNTLKTELMVLDTSSVTLAADGTESSVQLSTIGAWTVE